MNIIAKIVATLKYIEQVNWYVSKGTDTTCARPPLPSSSHDTID